MERISAVLKIVLSKLQFIQCSPSLGGLRSYPEYKELLSILPSLDFSILYQAFNGFNNQHLLRVTVKTAYIQT